MQHGSRAEEGLGGTLPNHKGNLIGIAISISKTNHKVLLIVITVTISNTGMI